MKVSDHFIIWKHHTRCGQLSIRVLDRVGCFFKKCMRWCFSYSLRHCVGCGQAVGMGTLVHGAMWCDSCYNEWSPYMRMGLRCDWRGFGRRAESTPTRLEDTETEHAV